MRPTWPLLWHARWRPVVAVAALAGAGLAAGSIIAPAPIAAHKALLSKYGYNAEVFPILQAKCGACHVKGGVAPMSLLSYQDAFPWAQAIKEEVLALRMPPLSNVTPAERFANVHPLNARELDILVDWANGATPEGEQAQPSAPALATTWPLGAPDLELPVPGEFTLASGEMAGAQEYRVPTGRTTDLWLRAIDVRPTAPAMVRSVGVWLGEVPVALWIPGQIPVVHEQAGVKIPAGATLLVRIAYKKTWSDETNTLTDRTSVGLYVHPKPPPRTIDTVPLVRADAEPGATHAIVRTIDADSRLLSFVARFAPDTEADVLDLALEQPDGTRLTLLSVERPLADWQTRLWFIEPVAAAKGSRVVATARASRTAPAFEAWMDVTSEPPATAAARR